MMRPTHRSAINPFLLVNEYGIIKRENSKGLILGCIKQCVDATHRCDRGYSAGTTAR